MFDVDTEKGLTLIELADGVSLEDVRAVTGCQFEVCVCVCVCAGGRERREREDGGRREERRGGVLIVQYENSVYLIALCMHYKYEES